MEMAQVQGTQYKLKETNLIDVTQTLVEGASIKSVDNNEKAK